jgi:hypothetical protein
MRAVSTFAAGVGPSPRANARPNGSLKDPPMSL